MHVLLAMLVTAIFMALFVVSAIVHENAYSLLAVVVLSTLVVVRVAYYAVRIPGHTVQLLLHLPLQRPA